MPIINNQNFRDKKDAQGNLYTDTRATSEYERDTGILVIPIAGPAGTPPLVVQAHSPYGFRVDKFGYSKRNTPPVIPSPDAETSTGDILLNANLNFMQPRIRDNQNHLEYAVYGTYTYVQSSVRDEGSTYPTQEYVHVTPQMNPEFDTEEKGFYSDSSDFLNIGIGGIIGGALAAIQALNVLTPQSILQKVASTSPQNDPYFTVQTTTYFPTFFKPDAIV